MLRSRNRIFRLESLILLFLCVKNTVREVALCNHWENFVTLTFDSRWDRNDLQKRIKELIQWIQNINKKGSNIRYVFSEFHADAFITANNGCTFCMKNKKQKTVNM